MEITDRLENLKTKSLSLRHSEVVDSFSKAVRKWGRLTPRQESFLGSIEAQYDEEAIAERQEKLRRVQEDEEYRKDVEIVCRYYIMSGYYRNTAREWLAFILDPASCVDTPNIESLENMMGNKYAQNIVENTKAPAKFAVGELVQMRSNPSWENVKSENGGNAYARDVLGYDAFMVIEVDSRPVSRPLTYHKTQGGTRWYKLLPLGSTSTFEVCERELKRPTKKLLGKK